MEGFGQMRKTLGGVNLDAEKTYQLNIAIQFTLFTQTSWCHAARDTESSKAF